MEPLVCKRVLFIGNSYTAGWGDESNGALAAQAGGVPGLLQQMAMSRGRELTTSMLVRGGTALHEHLDDRGRLKDALQERPWDAVVLQEYSTLPTRKGDATHGTADDFLAAVIALREQIVKSRPDAEILLYETWARAEGDRMYPRYIPSVDEMTRDLQAWYGRAAAAIHARVAPVGTAWSNALGERPAFRLHAEDGAHPAAAGVYLASLVFYATLFRDDPRGLPALAGVSENDASFLQQVAWKTVCRNATV